MTDREAGDALIVGRYGYASMTRRCLSLLTLRPGMLWWAGLLVSGGLAGVMVVSIAWVLIRGVGVWGIDQPTAWGFAITNFVWWIGIGHAGTLISAILLLLRQRWRNSINRFAEAMTLFAIAMAGLFPLLHLGRIVRFYYLFPYPNQIYGWPQWRSPLVWDVVAVMTYGIVSLLFLYMGLMPDLASLRDVSKHRWVRRVAGLLSLGWRGSSREWVRHHAVYWVLAAVATPLVVSVHSIVSLDFAVTIVPGWHATVFPPYFVAGAIFSGMAMVLTITVPLRRSFGLQDLITPRHFDAMGKVTLAAALVLAYGYVSEMFAEWWSGDLFELMRLHDRFGGAGAWIFYTMVVCNLVAPQALWWRRVRRAPAVLFGLSLVFNLGMWLERYDIVVSSLSHASHLPSTRNAFVPTFWDISLLLGSIGAFAFLFLLFIRVAPIIPIHEMRELVDEQSQKRAMPRRAVGPIADGATVLMARFADEESLAAAAGRVREAGFGGIEAYTPVRAERVERAMGVGRSRLPWAMAAGGVLGGLGAYGMQWYAATVSYPWNIGGRPMHSWPSFLPLTFELGVLTASLVGFVGFCLANRYPRPYHAGSEAASFARASVDRFWLAVDAGAAGEERSGRVELLRSLGAERVVGVQS